MENVGRGLTLHNTKLGLIGTDANYYPPDNLAYIFSGLYYIGAFAKIKSVEHPREKKAETNGQKPTSKRIYLQHPNILILYCPGMFVFWINGDSLVR